ncbi:Carbonic anhydrase [Bathymodiolus heckerae thiotrophic gill symbiont]|uniref:carbonic anhydrase n=1 Tax=Bathymodiolus heckerae thiotrophic gill symbiont TaxID=1052212 RepID=UPI0010BB4FA0|nr:carbonic anhydrase [Bathymodiolus heckerae thiotrophic gill symbiont]CAC9546674.1 Carbonic anhydrase, beta class (EC 4.2.1.1) [uncultured Gammaproteobacteria bacterium]CAC9601633.1 Carbonic anhydrase, beta class (EC 4.2.1.1) [uncultured Gammaproteobacteria bacterium]SHN91784.1 Carbonic anhydrase [Bathymodiolus heckerae thiotrophic gill symbiont]
MNKIVVNNANLRKLMEGNKRYMASHLIHPDQSSERRFELKHGQHPFAIILGCSDSRVPPEVIFDQGLGDLYVVRVVGNVLDQMIVASIEYAVLHLDVRLIMVMGHSQCGAVQATCNHNQLEGHLPSLTFALNAALNKAKDLPGDLTENVILANVGLVSEELKQTGAHFPEMMKKGELVIVPAYYHIDTGKVELLT